jgi:hypothetical protein
VADVRSHTFAHGTSLALAAAEFVAFVEDELGMSIGHVEPASDPFTTSS